MTEELDGQLGWFDQDTWCGRTCPEHSQAESQKEQTSRPSSMRSSKSSAKKLPLFLSLWGGWPKAGCISGVGDSGCTFSIAYRLHDAQFWGVPQRRKRIALVADFGGLSAPEILFERTGLRGDIEESGTQGQGTPAGTERGS